MNNAPRSILVLITANISKPLASLEESIWDMVNTLAIKISKISNENNPNVVVNADAENVIVANQKGQNDKETSSSYKFDYINGSIENTKEPDSKEKDLLKSMGIREHIAEIVEGGKEAFKKREIKYGFK